MTRAVFISRTIVVARATAVARAIVVTRAAAVAGTVVVTRAIVLARTFVRAGAILVARAIVVARTLLLPRAVVVARSIVGARTVVAAARFGAHGTVVMARAILMSRAVVMARAIVVSRTVLVPRAIVLARTVVAARGVRTDRTVVVARAIVVRATSGRVVLGADRLALGRVRGTTPAAVGSVFGDGRTAFAALEGGTRCRAFLATTTATAATTAASTTATATLAFGTRRALVAVRTFAHDFELAFVVFVDVFVLVPGVNVFLDRLLDLGGTVGRFGARRALLASAVAAPAIVSAAAPVSAAIPTGLAAATGLVADAVRVHVADFEELGRDRIGQEQRTAVVEVDALFPRVAGAHRDHDVVVRGAAPGLDGVLGRQREVQESTATRAQSVATRAIGVGARHAHEQLGRRLRGLARLHVDRVTVERADLRALDLVTLAIAAEHRLAHVDLVDGFAQALVEGADHVVHLSEPELVDLEVELLRLVAEHVGERAGDAFDQGGMGHGLVRRFPDTERRPGTRPGHEPRIL